MNCNTSQNSDIDTVVYYYVANNLKLSRCLNAANIADYLGGNHNDMNVSKARIPTLTQYVPNLTWSFIAESEKELYLSSKTVSRNYPDKK